MSDAAAEEVEPEAASLGASWRDSQLPQLLLRPLLDDEERLFDFLVVFEKHLEVRLINERTTSSSVPPNKGKEP
jgi:hypothetical protein